METADILVYSNSIPSRLQYTTDFIGNYFFDQNLRITKSPDDFKSFNGIKINYSNDKLHTDEFRIVPHSLLFGKKIEPQEIICSEINGLPVFFETEGDLPFDIFAAIFYLLSRYEEYLPHQQDEYGRYDYENSLAFKEKFLDQPLVNKWLNWLKGVLRIKFRNLVFIDRETVFLPTYDIDEAWSYKSKSGFRTLGGLGKALMKGDWERIHERRKVLTGEMQDPFDSFEWMDRLNKDHQLQPIYFFLVPESTGKYDRNILPSSKSLQHLIRSHSKKYRIGIHPSWQSGDDPSLLKKEIQTLESISGRHIESSRQHFIRFTMPSTYRLLIDSGITTDYSMGYGNINGFRASIASPFPWYDLEKEMQTRLTLFPFCYMEANSFFELEHTPEQALDEMLKLFNEVKSVNGSFIPIWHNTFLGTEKRFRGWREIYQQFLSKVSV